MRTSTHTKVLNTTLTLLAASILAACGGGGDDPAPAASGTSGSGSTSVKISGVVTATSLVAGSATDPTIQPAYIQGAKVCVDANANGVCDAGEGGVLTDAKGRFTITLAANAALIADIGTDAVNTASGAKVASRDVLRASLEQVVAQSGGVVISPLSSEVARLREANGSTQDTEVQNVAKRIGVSAATLLADVNTVSGTDQRAMLAEARALDNRFTYAVTKLDRGDLYPDDLAVAGGDPRLVSQANVTQATVPTKPDTRARITFAQSQQAAFEVEGVPRYDNIFVVMLENKATSSILNSAFAPKINALLKAGNQLTSYYATGNPSEPNYTALGGADDFGISDDSQWNCDATGANAVQDLPLPDNTQPGLAKSPFAASCTQAAAINHNIVGRPNLFNALTAAGLNWRTYSESMNPGQDFRTDSVADAAVVGQDHVYAPGTVGGNPATVGTTGLNLPMPAGLYKTKHHPGMAYQNVRSAPEWKYSNRTMGGGQWDAALASSTDYAIPTGYDIDQLGTDLASGNVGSLNFVMPDQCDDMHGITVKGTVGGGSTQVTASDCGGSAIITRGDNYVDALVKKIQASPLWQNPQRRVAIVVMFDEGTATGGFNSCCGWNVSNSTLANPLKDNGDGTFSPDTSINNYAKGNRGHGQSIFGILTNQAVAPKGIVDGDAYSHFSLVRTFQDMFQLADPGVEGSYMNRSKYTEHFVAANILKLPEYAGSADTHFDAVRPINHAWVAPSNYTQKQSSDVTTPAQVGPDAVQTSVWALK
ncbi:alkaline phosphatase family protein [Variovorax sp. N23]|uniref:alkaline phosphatase family protein n=1 Tax=Variovorax sp. N23 TaxID=2980555 RepID=UPI0021C8C5B7|nr:alkaline phosphatase family protein [Variovorax sp. N23]MCU4119252.1 phosphoesterase [Variovorax sp. N23]